VPPTASLRYQNSNSCECRQSTGTFVCICVYVWRDVFNPRLCISNAYSTRTVNSMLNVYIIPPLYPVMYKTPHRYKGLGIAAALQQRRRNNKSNEIMRHSPIPLLKSLLKYDAGAANPRHLLDAFSALLAVMGEKGVNSVRRGAIITSR
jgi:hypothetical protein